MTDASGHQPVLLEQVIESLAIQPSGKYVDATFGRGGHAKAILERLGEDGQLMVIDQDPAAIEAAHELFDGDKRVIVQRGSFADIEDYIGAVGWVGQVDGILMDLGVSSPQLDDAQRGFSFMREGPLDMRMNPDEGIDCATWLAEVEEREIIRILRVYGEEKFAKRIARAIVEARVEQPITTTTQLAKIIADAVPVREFHKHPATRSFQAIRIYLNRELEALQQGLQQCLTVMKVGGRLLVISFHSLEDRIVKRFVRFHEQSEQFPPELPLTPDQLGTRMRRVGKAIRADDREINRNPRSRSAVLRVAEKLL